MAEAAETTRNDLADLIDPDTSNHGGARPNSGGKRLGSGRKPGTPNKLTANIKAAILEAFEQLGGVEYLVQVGHDDPRTFIGLVGQVLPTQLEAPEGGLQLTIGRILDEIDGMTSDVVTSQGGNTSIGASSQFAPLRPFALRLRLRPWS